MRNTKGIAACVMAVFVFSACTLLSKKELENSLLVHVSAEEMFSELTMHSKNADFQNALALTRELQSEQPDKTYTELFGQAYDRVAPGTLMASHFFTMGLHEKIDPRAGNKELLEALQKELDYKIDATINVLRVRLDRYGLPHHYIQRIDHSEDILIELPEVENIDRLKSLIETRAELGFWQTYELSEVHKYFNEANEALQGIDIWEIQSQLASDKENVKAATTESADEEAEEAFREEAEKYPIYTFLNPALEADETGEMRIMPGPVVGTAQRKDTAMVNYLLNQEQVRKIFPEDLHLCWSYKPLAQDGESMQLFAVKAENKDRAPVNYMHITGASLQADQNDRFEVHVSMNNEGGKIWGRLTKLNIGKCIAIMLDDYVYTCPLVKAEIPGGKAVISGNFTEKEALDIANILQTGPLPLPVTIVEENF